MASQDLFKLETRRQIYNFIQKNPGLHFRDIAKKMDIPRGTLEYHFRHMEKQSLIDVKPSTKYTRYYVLEKIGIKEKEIISLLRRETPRRILVCLMSWTGESLVEINDILEKKIPTIAFRLKKLQKIDIIEPAKVVDGFIYRPKNLGVREWKSANNEKVYVLKDPEVVYKLLITLKKNILDDIAVTPLIDVLEDWFASGGYPERLPHHASVEDNVLWAIFPHPCHA